MQSRPSWCESEATPSNGGQPATHVALHFSSDQAGPGMRPNMSANLRTRVAARFGAWAAALCIALMLGAGAMPASAQAAGASTGTPVIPALQSLINSATATPAPAASGASAPDAASAPSPASQAELARSLDSVIATLDNDRQRTALVTQLKKLRDVSQNVAPPAPAAAPHNLVLSMNATVGS